MIEKIVMVSGSARDTGGDCGCDSTHAAEVCCDVVKAGRKWRVKETWN